MARTLDQIVTLTLGELQLALVKKQAQIEQQADEIARLMALIPTSAPSAP